MDDPVADLAKQIRFLITAKVLEERERCAVIADQYQYLGPPGISAAEQIAQRIRSTNRKG